MKQLAQQESGQSLLVVALAIVGIVAMLALVLDAGYLYAQRRLVQNAVDAAALGAAREVASGNATDASVRASMEDYAARNSPAGGLTVEGTYVAANNGELEAVGNGAIPALAKGVKVVGTTSVTTFFAGVVGLGSGRVSATAVARFSDPIGPGGWAVWSGTTANCASGGVGWNASSSTIEGGLHSNSTVQFGGGGAGTVIYGNVETVGGVRGANVTYAGTIPYPIEGIVESNPLRTRAQDFQPGSAAAVAAGSQYYYVAGELTRTTRDGNNQPYFDSATGILRTGLYYVTGDVRFTGGVSGTVTIVARGVISIKGGDNQLRLFQPGGDPCAVAGIVLFTDLASSNLCADAGNVIELSGNNNLWAGLIYAPQGRVSLSGSQLGTSVLTGAIVAQTVDIAGANVTLRWTQYCALNAGPGYEYLMQ